jgi:hypothetical protein
MAGELLHSWLASDTITEPTDAGAARIESRNTHKVAYYSDHTPQSLDFAGVLSRVYGGGGLTVNIIWTSRTAVTGDVVWDAQIESFTPDADDLDVDGFVAANTVTDTVGSAAGEPMQAAITFTDGADMDSLAIGEYFRLRITRDTADAADTLVGDAQVVAVEIIETA